jgi:hypothetical protein
MLRILLLSVLITHIALAQTLSIDDISIQNTTEAAPVSVFPLKIGNEWVYEYCQYYYNYDPMAIMFQGCDTGYASVKVIDLIGVTDSTRWVFEQTKTLWSQYNNGSFWGPNVSIDTFEVIRLHAGNRRLYRSGDAASIRFSIFPFLYDVDTMVYQLAVVDTAGYVSFGSHSYAERAMIEYIFKQNTGLVSVTMSDGCLCMDMFGTQHSLRTFTPADVDDKSECPLIRDFTLHQNYPNPFNPSTTISFSTPRRSYVSLKIYDCLGKEVAVIVSGYLSAGFHSNKWNAAGIPSGIYFCRLQSGLYVDTKKLILLK